jgi:thioredoxin 2
MIIKCQACGASNKVRDDINQKPLCGRCGSPLMLHHSAMPVHLNDATFDTYIRKAHKPVLVDFWAAWCAPCRVLAPILENFAISQHSIIVAKLDTERSPLTASRFQIFSIPTLILFVNGEEVKRLTGAVPLQELEKQLRPWISIN